jgi:hypothetical protein
MSGLPPKADIARREWQVCFVPKANITRITPAMHLGLYDMYV